ncbi:peptidase c14 caspase catalytic subunit p20 [Fusarium flagelliforme]|uniref:Peptidase c14 caspase catalytic subunit p20 n=1 Tax=Fusarium flagelliforme TaxID=2675880 RepID=A0A395M9T1_9HYPO|nr:peptidase c14 caspase catalytic subunit p20 [Fusarium flagelliforme]
MKQQELVSELLHSAQNPAMRRALLIGSPYNGLLGTEYDVEAMRDTLQASGFQPENITTLCNEGASRDNILHEWNSLIHQTLSEDVLVIYYSGHGGLAQSDIRGEAALSHVQFIVPYDFDPTLKTWRGIFDGELSELLSRSTASSHNVTYILDCCHSARNGREVSGFSGKAKALSLSQTEYDKLTRHFNKLEESGQIRANNITANPFAVRIAAAAVHETAWECSEIDSNPMGLLTRYLTSTIAAANGELSWRQILRNVGALLERRYPGLDQHPRSAGSDNRVPFSMETRDTQPFIAKTKRGGIAVVQAGRVHGIQNGDQFHVVPFGSGGQPTSTGTTMVVTELQGFISVLGALPGSTSIRLSPDLDALAVLFNRERRQPAQIPAHEGQPQLRSRIERSLQFRPSEPNDDALVEFRNNGDSLSLYSSHGLQLGSERLDVDSAPSLIEKLVTEAEIYCEAQSLLTLESGANREALNAHVKIELGLEVDYKRQPQAHFSETPPPQDAVIDFIENDRLYLQIENGSNQDVYVNVLNINAIGEVTLVSRFCERGIRLLAGDYEFIAAGDAPFEGLAVSRPGRVPREASIVENFVCVITTEEVDLRSLETTQDTGRGVPPAGRKTVIPYKVIRFPYSISIPGS